MSLSQPQNQDNNALQEASPKRKKDKKVSEEVVQKRKGDDDIDSQQFSSHQEPTDPETEGLDAILADSAFIALCEELFPNENGRKPQAPGDTPNNFDSFFGVNEGLEGMYPIDYNNWMD